MCMSTLYFGVYNYYLSPINAYKFVSPRSHASFWSYRAIELGINNLLE